MLIVNNILYESNSIYNFINASVNWMINNNSDLTASKEYWLFYFIKDDFAANFNSLFNVDIDTDFFGFPTIRKNTRHAIEAFLDLYNLCHDQDYMEVLKWNSNKGGCVKKYNCIKKNVDKKSMFTIYDKCKIAKEMYNGNFYDLVDTSKDSNKYVHPDVFIDTISIDERDKKEKILSELLKTNIFLLNEAYKLLRNKFNQNCQPYLGCCGSALCLTCYNNAYDKFQNCITNKLFIKANSNSFY